MGTIGVVLMVIFIIVCVLLVLLVSIQDDGENGMGGLLGGRGTAAFGAHSASVLTKATAVLVTLFFVLTIALALVNKQPKTDKFIDSIPEEEIAAPASTDAGNWWDEAVETSDSTEATE